MSYYNAVQTYYPTYNHTNYSQYSNWGNKWYGNGYTAMSHANKWYRGWNAISYRWYNNCWWIYMRHGNHYRTVCIGPNYNWHWYKNGFWR